MDTGMLLWMAIVAPLLGCSATLLLQGPRVVLGAAGCVAGVAAALDLTLVVAVFSGGSLSTFGGWLFADALSAWHLLILSVVFVLSSAFSLVYFDREIRDGGLTMRQARTFAMLWQAAIAAMTLVLLSNNLGIMWVGIEATTLVTAFLISVHPSRESLEAMWKYLLICSVGVALAFMGTLLLAASARSLGLDSAQLLLWTTLHDHAAGLNPMLAKIAFVFLLVGYGTKAGLAPMHTWLPDAHSQAPTPVSALFSGFMLSTAMYGIMRVVPIVEIATGGVGWASGLLVVVGLLSTMVAAVFILFQGDVKRLLAYSSVEHMGIIAVGLGLGGIGVFAALFHTLNHALAKSLSFLAAGRLGQVSGSHRLRDLRGMFGISRLWAVALFAGLFALIGVAPLAPFMSEFQMVKAALDARAIAALVVFLASVTTVFIGVVTHLIPLAWDSAEAPARLPLRSTAIEMVMVAVPLGALIVLGLFMPTFLRDMIDAAAAVIRSTGTVIAPHAGDAAL